MIPFWVKALVVGLVVAGLVAACHHRDAVRDEAARTEQRTVDQEVADKLKADAVLALAAETQRVVTAQDALRKFKDTQEIKDADNRKIIVAQGKRLSVLAGDSGRLRDPNQTGGCGGGSGGAQGPKTAASGVGGDNAAEGTGLLSKELSGLLQRLTDEADAINVAYAACRSDGEALRAAP